MGYDAVKYHREYWVVEYRKGKAGPVGFKCCDDRAEAEKIVQLMRAEDYLAVCWKL